MSRVPHMCGKIEFPSTSEMSVQPEFFFSGEMFRCGNIYRNDSEDHGERRSSEDKFSPQGGLSLEAATEWHHKWDRRARKSPLMVCIHAAVNACNDTQKGGEGQVQSTTSTPQDTTVPTGTQSTGISTSTNNTVGGVGGSDPPEDGQGRPPVSGHYRDYEGEAQGDSEDEFEDIPLSSPEMSDDETDDSTEKKALPGAEASNGETSDQNDNGESIQTSGANRDIICNGCNRRPRNVQVFFTAECSDDGVLICISAYCCQECAEKGRTGSQVVTIVNLWDTECLSFKECSACCLKLDTMPLTVCRLCKMYMCGNCSQSCRIINGNFKCSIHCIEDGGIDSVRLPAYIAAGMKTIDLTSPVQGNELMRELAYVLSENATWHVLHPRNWPNDDRQISLYIQRRLLEDAEQARQHHRRQLEEEDGRLEEANELQALFPATEVQGSSLLVENDGLLVRASGTHAAFQVPWPQESSSESVHVARHLSDDSDQEATAAGPPAEEFQPPNSGGEVEQGTEIEEDSLEQRSNQQQRDTVG